MNNTDLFFDHSEQLMRQADTAVANHPESFAENFSKWLNENGHVWVAFHDKARALERAGRTNYGSRAIIEVLRFESALQDSGEPWKINNNCTAQLARLFNIVADYDFFSTRDRVH